MAPLLIRRVVLFTPTWQTLRQSAAKSGARAHGLLEGGGGVRTSEAYHLKADTLVIPEMCILRKFTGALFGDFGFIN